MENGRWLISRWGNGPWLRKDPGMVPCKVDANRFNAIPEDIARLAYEEYKIFTETDLTFEEIAEHGGINAMNVISALADALERERAKVSPADIIRKNREAYIQDALTNDLMPIKEVRELFRRDL